MLGVSGKGVPWPLLGRERGRSVCVQPLRRDWAPEFIPHWRALCTLESVDCSVALSSDSQE